MQRLVIIGNSGSARECHRLFVDAVWNSPTLRQVLAFKGFLAHKGFAGSLEPELAALQLASDDEYTPCSDDVFIVGIGDCALRNAAYTAMKARGGRFINLVSPWCYLPGDIRLGEGNIIAMGCSFSPHVAIGNVNYFNGNVNVGHDVTIGDGNFFGPGSIVLGNAVIGSQNRIGAHGIHLERSKMGDNNALTPGSTLYKGCRDNAVMHGNPALNIK